MRFIFWVFQNTPCMRQNDLPRGRFYNCNICNLSNGSDICNIDYSNGIDPFFWRLFEVKLS